MPVPVPQLYVTVTAIREHPLVDVDAPDGVPSDEYPVAQLHVADVLLAEVLLFAPHDLQELPALVPPLI